MRAIGRGTVVGAWLGASKGIMDLHQVRNRQNPHASNMYVDKVTPPPTYVHAAADQGIVGALLGAGTTLGVLMRDEYERERALRRVGHRAGRRDRAAHDHETFATTRPQGRARSHTNTAHLLNDEDEDAGG